MPKKTAFIVNCHGGDNLFGLTDNQPSIHQIARDKLASRLARAIRDHWSVENKNHWVRDTSLWKEDATRPRKKASGGQVLALIRGAILRLHDQEIFESLNASFHYRSAKPNSALRLLKTPSSKIN